MNWHPDSYFIDKKKTIWVLESTRLTGPMSWKLIYHEKIAAQIKQFGFKKIIFIKHRYNKNEYTGWVYNFESDRFE